MDEPSLAYREVHVSSSRKRLFAVTTMLLGIVLGLLGCEFVLALLMPPPLRYYYPQPLHVPDSSLGWVMKPNQHSYTIDKPVVTNSDGFRSPPVRQPKPASGLRIICLGDSQTFGNGVAQDETYPARLQTRLTARESSASVEVINAGIQAYGIHQEVRLLERIAPVLKPDFVTIGFYLNDIFDVLRSVNDTEITEGEFKREGALKQFIPYSLIYALKRSRLITLLYWKYRIWDSDLNGDPTKEILLGKTPEKLQKSWKLIEDTLLRARSLAAAHRFRLIVFPVPVGQEFLAEYPNEEYRSRFLALAEKLAIHAIDPTPQMKSAGGGFERYFITWDGHINSLTHDYISEFLFNKINVLSKP